MSNDMEFGTTEFAYGFGLVTAGWIAGMSVSYVFSLVHAIRP
jgi:hypothetical protein